MRQCVSLFSSCACTAILSLQSAAAVEDDQISDLWNVQSSISASSEMRRAKRRQLRDGDWVHSIGLDAQAGYIDNMFLSPESAAGQNNLETDSILYSVGAYWTLERDFDKNHKLDIDISASSIFFEEDSDADSTTAELELSYDQDLSETVCWESSVEIQYASDDATDIFGDPYARDFAYKSYQAKSGLDWDASDAHKLGTSVSYKLKDYNETSGMNSIDWNELELRLTWRWKLNEQFKLRAQYDYSLQNYDDEPANNAANGLEPPGNPEEEHHFQKITLSAYWYPRDGAKTWFKVTRREKDDQFEGYESYDELQLRLGASAAFAERWSVKAEFSSKERDFDKRPGPGAAETLTYDQRQADVYLRRSIDEHQSVYCGYSLAERDSNRDTGTVYRDYVVHTMILGFGWQF